MNCSLILILCTLSWSLNSKCVLIQSQVVIWKTCYNALTEMATEIVPASQLCLGASSCRWTTSGYKCLLIVPILFQSYLKTVEEAEVELWQHSLHSCGVSKYRRLHHDIRLTKQINLWNKQYYIIAFNWQTWLCTNCKCLIFHKDIHLLLSWTNLIFLCQSLSYLISESHSLNKLVSLVKELRKILTVAHTDVHNYCFVKNETTWAL